METNPPNLDLEDNRVTPSSGNVFADLGFDQPEEMLLKAELVRQISAAIKEKGLNQYQAAELLGIDQPKVSALVRGHFSGYSLERLFRYLHSLGRELEIVVKSSSSSEASSKVKVTVI
jgi:predicted XRE-type DNA-binding protein